MFIRKLGRRSDKANHKCMMMIYESYVIVRNIKERLQLDNTKSGTSPVTSREGDYWKLIFAGEGRRLSSGLSDIT